MASTEFWQRVAATTSSISEKSDGRWKGGSQSPRGSVVTWMSLDALTVFCASVLATIYDLHTTAIEGAKGFWHGTLIHRRPTWTMIALLVGFTIALIFASRRLNLYQPRRLTSFLHEQRLSLQACLTAGLLLTGTLYMVHAADIPRGIVFSTVILVAASLSVRRLVYRVVLYRRFDRGRGTRNVLIVGTGPEAQALRHHLESIRHLGFTFKGFVDLPGARLSATTDGVVGTLDTLFQQARKLFVDEIFFTTPCERGIVQQVLDRARKQGVDLRVVPDLYDGLAWNSPIEYIGQFPTIPLHRGHVPELALVLKRVIDIIFSLCALIALAPILVVIAVAVKLDSPGTVFYSSERLGRKGRVFRCIKFRTMEHDAEKRRAELMHMNERDGVLFKVSNDPRITRLGTFLRKYSLDELPQFFNVLHGDMSVVGPRPPLASEVHQYKLSHLRRLDVTPGITGLWQVQGRRDPSFDSYVSLDVTYIENWSIWLDLKIIVRTVGVVLSGTGT